ncbi:MAG: hypothetical protein M3Y44_07535 [Actinomycetota bacterium]|nr:hypothetical protein [Actinomycetota bacterium]
MVDLIVHGEQLTVGVVTPHTAPGPEVELPALSRGRVATFIARTKSPPYASGGRPQPLASGVAGLRALSMPAVLDLATANFRNRSIDVIAYASTTSSYVLGRRAETALTEHIARKCNVPIVASGAAAVAGLRACAVQRVQLIHPPWFDDVFDALGVTYFRDHGFDAWVSKAISLPGDPARVSSSRSCNGWSRTFRTAPKQSFLPAPGSVPRTRSMSWSVARDEQSLEPTRRCSGKY